MNTIHFILKEGEILGRQWTRRPNPVHYIYKFILHILKFGKF